MKFDMIWQKLVEFAIQFYNYAMTQGESNFMIVNSKFMDRSDIPEEAKFFYFGSFIVMVIVAVFACDSFMLFHPIEGIKEWKNKISIVKVIIFAAAIFSFHTFYKMIVGITGELLGADASVRALVCLGSYINPIAILIYAFAITTLSFRRLWFQAFMLGLAIFFTPSVMAFYGFTNEHIAIYATAGAIAVIGGIIYIFYMYNKCSPFVACFVLDIVYFIGKYFMIFYSDEAKLISASNIVGRIKQYLACVQMDLIFSLSLLLVMSTYSVVTMEKICIKTNIILPIVLAIFTVLSIVCGQTELRYQPEYEQAIALWQEKKYEDAKTAFSALNGYKDSQNYMNQCIENINKSIYKQGVKLMRVGKYEKAIDKLAQIYDYKDVPEKIKECKTKLLPQLAGIWHGQYGEVIVLNEDGTCHYYDKQLNDNDGNWTVEDENAIKITFLLMEGELYVDLTNGYKSKSMRVGTDLMDWGDFNKVTDFTLDQANNSKLTGIWQGNQGSVVTLNEDGTCYYVDGSAGEGAGTWYVDNAARLRIDIETLDYQLYALLTSGYNSVKVTMYGTGSSWSDEEFDKQ